MRKTKPKTRQDLFIHILDLWLENELRMAKISEQIEEARKEYEAYLNLWDELLDGECEECIHKTTKADIDSVYYEALDDFERELLKWCNKERLADEEDIKWIKKRVRKDRIDEQSDN